MVRRKVPSLIGVVGEMCVVTDFCCDPLPAVELSELNGGPGWGKCVVVGGLCVGVGNVMLLFVLGSVSLNAGDGYWLSMVDSISISIGVVF